MALGRAALAWNTVEINVDGVTAILHHKGGGKHLKGYKKLPRAFSNKLDFISECRQQLPVLSDITGDIDLFVPRAGDLASTRNHFIHGMPDITTPVPAGVILYHKTEFYQAEVSISTIQTSITEIENFSNSALILGQAAHLLLRKVAQRHGYEIPVIN